MLIGNSAQIVHPFSAQGMNLGLRDAVTLLDSITSIKGNKLDLIQYDALRKKDAKGVINFTHNLTRFLDLDFPLKKEAITLGLTGFSSCKIIKNKIANNLVFGR